MTVPTPKSRFTAALFGKKPDPPADAEPVRKPNVVPREGTLTPKPAADAVREFVRDLFGHD